MRIKTLYKPIQAVQFKHGNGREIVNWLNGLGCTYALERSYAGRPLISINTDPWENVIHVLEGDWVVYDEFAYGPYRFDRITDREVRDYENISRR